MDRRPLTKSQRKYAAMDAMILVELYEVGALRREKIVKELEMVKKEEVVVGKEEENMLALRKRVRKCEE